MPAVGLGPSVGTDAREPCDDTRGKSTGIRAFDERPSTGDDVREASGLFGAVKIDIVRNGPSTGLPDGVP